MVIIWLMMVNSNLKWGFMIPNEWWILMDQSSQHLYVCWGEWDLVGGLNLPLWKMMKLPICMGKSYHKIPWFQSPSTRFLDGKPSKTHGLGKSSTMIFPEKWPFFWVFSHFCWEMSVTPATPLWSLISTLSCRVTISTLTVPRFPQSERVGLPNERKLLDFHSLLLEILVYEKHITILTGIVSVQFMFKHMIIWYV